MPINLQDIAAISGMSGLYRIIRPTRNGVIVETLDEQRNRMVAQARQRLSLLQEISIYTTDEEETIPLTDVMSTIKEKYGDSLPVNPKSSGSELAAFMSEVVPNYDADRVYTSDMKKLVQWYSIVSKFVPETAEPEAPAEEISEAKEEAPAKQKAKAKSTDKTAEASSESTEEKPKVAKKKKAPAKE